MKITEDLYNKIISLYPKWKELNQEIKKIYSRGINLHEAFSEIIVCYHFNLELNNNKNSNSVDAFDLQNKTYQIKGASSKNDLTSFGPSSIFDKLIFCYIQQDTDEMFVFLIDKDQVINILVNKHETFKQQQLQKRRPRFSLYKSIVIKNNLNPIKIINLRECIK
ncbi:Bsp6I family type II restriction endonuclease [Mycoplasma sp. SG1]|uniref:Bsp6I family type II restriction endonuclease n=1 Tax=Mycoplasma sp. SG1 TaxID=2810348 RepID=UPI0020242BAE|nr:Bsp6I family type II restriction endonuclease [Mycoplasma sp. SG1]URM53174.1 Bsp6I family type II restriction endonuclease [Mycoplasma sp. SG1]